MAQEIEQAVVRQPVVEPDLIASGKPMKEIAEELYLSIKTVSTYRARILEKMRLKTNTDLIRYTLRAGLLD
jgi:DNA-binding NarL/FixJ family response regulator